MPDNVATLFLTALQDLKVIHPQLLTLTVACMAGICPSDAIRIDLKSLESLDVGRIPVFLHLLQQQVLTLIGPYLTGDREGDPVSGIISGVWPCNLCTAGEVRYNVVTSSRERLTLVRSPLSKRNQCRLFFTNLGCRGDRAQ